MSEHHNFKAAAPDIQGSRVEFALWCANIAPVFRCARNGKPPLKEGWQSEATTDEATIHKWFGGPNPPNIGVATGGASCIIVVDLDCKNGKDGQGAFGALAEAHGSKVPKTLAVGTPSGGWHLFYRVPAEVAALTGNAGALGDGIDIRAAGNLVVGAGSTIDGKSYRVLLDFPIADAPQWLVDTFVESKASKAEARKLPDGVDVPGDAPHDIAQARSYLAEVQDIDGYDNAMAIGRRLGDFGILPETAAQLFDEEINPRLPAGREWELDELVMKMNDWDKGRENAFGSDSYAAAAHHFEDLRLPAEIEADIFGEAPANDNFDDLEAVLAEANDAGSGIRRAKGLTYQKASGVAQKPIEWLWPGHFAIGKIGGIAGVQGDGKSQITCYIAATVSTGGIWTGSDVAAPKGKVIILSAEDDIADTIAPRLAAAGADLDNCLIVSPVVDGKGGKHALNLADDLKRIEAMLEQEPGVVAVLIDPVSAYLGGKADAYRNTEMRAMLTPLGELAARRRVAVIFVTHFNKSGKGSAISRVTDSMAFTALARTFWLVISERDRDGRESGRKFFLDGKRNIAKREPGHCYQIEGKKLPNGIETSRVAWGDRTDIGPDEALAENKPRKGAPALKAAVSFLADLLANGPVPQIDVKEAAEREGHAWKTVRNAKDELGVEASRKDGKWFWEMLDAADWAA